MAEGVEVTDLSMINPDLPPPRLLHDRLLESVTKRGLHRYAVSRGIRKLREGFAVKYKNAFNVELDPEANICATFGSKDGIHLILPLFAHAGSKILLPKPTYPAHLSVVHLTGCEPVFFNLGSEAEMLAEISQILSSTAIEGVLINFPNNPLASTVSKDFLSQLITITERHGAYLINDFVYGEMTYNGGEAYSLFSPFGVRPHTLEVYSLSKAYSIPGWRVGAIMGSPHLIQAASRLKSHTDYGIFLPIQMAAALGLEDDVSPAREIVRVYQQRSKACVMGLERLGFLVSKPKAGAFIWAQLPEKILSQKYENPAMHFCSLLLKDEGVLLSPGTIFGDEYGEYVRVALVAEEDRLREVIKKIERVVQHVSG